MTKHIPKIIFRRRILQWVLAPIVLITIAFGWKYPLLGFSVPVVMLAGMIIGIFNGRYLCGNLCPRGGLFDRMIAPIGRKKSIPRFLMKMPLRWPVFAALMGFMVFRISHNPSDIMHWGYVFWMICVITTSIGVVLGIFLHQRAWCAFCPMGTMQNALGGGKRQLNIDSEKCIECELCEKACPINLDIIKHKSSGYLLNRDCLKCSECIVVCPKTALAWPPKIRKKENLKKTE